jgi:DNA-binding NtrC family response regulator
LPRRRSLCELAQHLDAVHAGHLVIQEHGVRRRAFQEIEPCPAIRRLKRFVTAEIEELLGRLLKRPAALGRGSEGDGADRLVGNSPQMREVQKLIGRAAGGSSSVLITCETGTGNELVARLLHDSSSRAGKSFVAVTAPRFRASFWKASCSVM